MKINIRYFLIVLCLCVATCVHAEEICIIDRPPLVERIENRLYPSISGFGQFDLLNKRPPDDVDDIWEWSYHKEMLAHHDLFFIGTAFRAVSTRHFPQPQLVVEGPLWYVHQERTEVQKLNPNFLLLTNLDYYGTSSKHYPEDWPYWLRDESGNIIEDEGWDALTIDYTLPGAQDHLVKQAIAIAKCGIFDGIFLDWWGENEDNEAITGVDGAGHLYHGNRADALVSLVRRIREVVGDDFLIMVNTDDKIPRSAPYINGAFMETLYDGRTGIGKAHAREHFIEIENVLLWSEENFRYPQVNFLEAFGIASQPPDSPENQRQARAFTTLSLTHSNGYVSYTTGIIGPFEDHPHAYEIWEGHTQEHARGEYHIHHHQKYWYSFYDADLGRPIGEKGQTYENPKEISIEGVFIREFTNGWAVYNRSGKEHNIYLPEKVSGVASGVEDKHWHILPDLDGEIYLKKIAPVVEVTGNSTIDSEGPSVSLSAPTDTQSTAFDITITFTAAVSDFIQEDVSIGGTADASITAWTANADGKTYTATVTPPRSGTVILTVAENVATDTDNRGNSAASSQVVSVFIPDSDVNGDGVTDILDLVVVAQHLGKSVPPNSDVDVNGDGVVSILDLIFVAQRLGGQNAAAAPAIIADTPDAAVIQAWIARAQVENDGSIVFQQGIANLQRLLASLIPERTRLLANYPNPFNPETWIPYHLANPSEVQITIYDTRGTLVRRLELGHQRAAHYARRSRAAYWDGRNAVGERVASGVYFYQFQADNMSLLRKMVILK